MKTVATKKEVQLFIKKIVDESKRKDCEYLIEVCTDITGSPPVIWGDSIIGFGHYHYVYDSGREGDFFRVGFSPRKQNLVLYIMSGVNRYPDLLASLGPHKTGKSCLYLTSLQRNDLNVLKELITTSVQDMNKRYP